MEEIDPVFCAWHERQRQQQRRFHAGVGALLIAAALIGVATVCFVAWRLLLCE